MIARYYAQVALLVKVLPTIANFTDFALKGGTAINLFYCGLPRLSVDIDLVYLPQSPRDHALESIDRAFGQIVQNLEQRGFKAQRIKGGSGGDTRLMVRDDQAQIKVEVSPVMRGTVNPPQWMDVHSRVEDTFGFASTQVVSFEDLYAGKLHAALTRQHPRDLYDVRYLLHQGGLTDDLINTFMVYAVCSNRPIHEVIRPREKDITQEFADEFDGMTNEPVPLGDLLQARTEMISGIHERMSDLHRHFLISMHACEPDFESIGLGHANNLSAIQWKLLNLRKLKTDNPEKHTEQAQILIDALDGTTRRN